MEASGKTFVLSGQFALRDKKSVVERIEARGGRVAAAVSKKVDYAVVGGSRSNLWKFGAYGAKIEKARGSKARARRSRSSLKEISLTRSAKTTHIPLEYSSNGVVAQYLKKKFLTHRSWMRNPLFQRHKR